MSKSILLLVLGAFTATCWWAIATQSTSREIGVPCVLFAIFSSLACVVIIAFETLNILDKPTKK